LPRQKLVFDTSVCLDLALSGLLDSVVQLRYDLLLPDVIVAELIEPPGEDLLRRGFIQESFSSDEVQQVLNLHRKYPMETVNDLFGLLLAQKNSCSLITGDAGLRKTAQSESVEVHGLLWLLDLMVEENALDPLAAANALELLMGKKRWLPKAESEKRIKTWRR